MPVVVVAVLAAMVLTAVALKWHALGRASHGSMTTAQGGRPTGPAAPAGGGDVRVEGSLGAGPPPEDASALGGAPMLHGDARHTHRSSGRVTTSLPVVTWTRDVGGP